MDIKKFTAITTGFANFVFKTKYHEELAHERAKICAECPNMNPEHPFKKWIPEDKRTEIISKAGCSLCGCLLSAKVRQTLERCPENKW